MVYLNCSNSLAGTPGAECLRSCHTLDVGCVSSWPRLSRASGRGGQGRGPSFPSSRAQGSGGPGDTYPPGSSAPARELPWGPLGAPVPEGEWHLPTLVSGPDWYLPGPHSSAHTACPAVSVPRGWCQMGVGAASPRRTAPACTTRPATGPARPSGLAAIPGMRGAQSPWGVSGSGYQRPSLETGEPPAQGSRENAGHRLRAGCSQQPQAGRPSGRVSVVLGPPGGRKAAPSQAGTLWVL